MSDCGREVMQTCSEVAWWCRRSLGGGSHFEIMAIREGVFRAQTIGEENVQHGYWVTLEEKGILPEQQSSAVHFILVIDTVQMARLYATWSLSRLLVEERGNDSDHS